MERTANEAGYCQRALSALVFTLPTDLTGSGQRYQRISSESHEGEMQARRDNLFKTHNIEHLLSGIQRKTSHKQVLVLLGVQMYFSGQTRAPSVMFY